MSGVRRVVFDTSTLVGAVLREGSIPDQALAKALGSCELCGSLATLDELATVLDRNKFDAYMNRASRRAFVELMRRHIRLIAVDSEGHESLEPACRDPRDNKFLALALAAEAEVIVSSDDDLLVLHPWRRVSIVSPRDFIA